MNQFVNAATLRDWSFTKFGTMLNQDGGTPGDPEASEPELQPSWKPLFWLIGILTVSIGLGELLLEVGEQILDLLFEVIEKLWLVVIEAPEELLEDQIENWLEQHFPHDAARYSEIITAIGLTPFKIILGIFLLMWLWRLAHAKFIPRIKRWLIRNYRQVELAWKQLHWLYKGVAIVACLGVLIILI